jgi:hypothetical protein
MFSCDIAHAVSRLRVYTALSVYGANTPCVANTALSFERPRNQICGDANFD